MKVKIEDLVDGAVIYKVTVWGTYEKPRSFIEKMVISGIPFHPKHMPTHLFCNYRADAGHFAHFSLDDSNIIPNKYNLHQAFTTSEEAYEYQSRILDFVRRTPEENEMFKSFKAPEFYR